MTARIFTAQQRTREAMRSKAARGYVAGATVYGYRNVRMAEGHLSFKVSTPKAEWITCDAPALVSEAAWTAARQRLAGTRAAYVRTSNSHAGGRRVRYRSENSLSAMRVRAISSGPLPMGRGRRESSP